MNVMYGIDLCRPAEPKNVQRLRRNDIYSKRRGVIYGTVTLGALRDPGLWNVTPSA